MITDGGRTLATVRRFVAGLMVRVPSQLVDLDDEEQLAAVARRFLVPMLGYR